MLATGEVTYTGEWVRYNAVQDKNSMIAYEESGLGRGSEGGESDEGRSEHVCMGFQRVKERQGKREWVVSAQESEDKDSKRRGSWQEGREDSQALFEWGGVQIRAIIRVCRQIVAVQARVPPPVRAKSSHFFPVSHLVCHSSDRSACEPSICLFLSCFLSISYINCPPSRQATHLAAAGSGCSTFA